MEVLKRTCLGLQNKERSYVSMQFILRFLTFNLLLPIASHLTLRNAKIFRTTEFRLETLVYLFKIF